MARQSLNYHITGCYYTLVNQSITVCGEAVFEIVMVRNYFSPFFIADKQLVDAGIDYKVHCYL